MEENRVLLSVENLDSGYGEMQILFNIEMEVREDEIVSIIGPDGAGKSTLMKSIFGLLKPWTGQITFQEKDITGHSPTRIVRNGMCYVPQTENTFPSLTVKENLEMGAFTRRDDFSGRIQEIFEMFPDLAVKKNQRAGKLSGGQQQMVAMGRALMLDPKILLLDEPTANLDFMNTYMVLDKLAQIKDKSILITTHDPNLALKYAQHVAFMKDGEVLGVIDVGEDGFKGNFEGLLSRTYGADVRVGMEEVVGLR